MSGRPLGSPDRHGKAVRRVPMREGRAYLSLLGAELRRARESVDVSAYEVAAALGVHAHTVMHWETGRRMPTLANVRRIALALGMRTESLLPEEI